MGYPLEDRRILIISPQKWGAMMVSKHHYAVELARRGNQVWFLNPPARELRPRLTVESPRANLSVVSHRPYFNLNLRFHLRPLYDVFMRAQTRLLVRRLGRFDVVWCFDTNLYSSLADFGAARIVYHVVDQFEERRAFGPAREADLIVSVAREILDRFTEVPRPKLLVNHGIASRFAELARARLDERAFAPRSGERLRIGYVGNLLIPRLDRDTLVRLVRERPDLEFHFWGDHGDRSGFVALLERNPNVRLHGAIPAEQLAESMQSMDAFLVCYEWWKDLNEGCNTHKLLEYLSTGKVVIASRIAGYAGSDLIRMSTSRYNADLVELFNATVEQLDEVNAAPLQEKRIRFALENTYERHVDAVAQALP
jgi:glycosyltransferase involved in cell wall biosynthesis